MMELFKLFQVIGWFLLLCGIIIDLGNLLGWSQPKERKEFYSLVISSRSGIPVSHPAVREFIEKFPPPPGFERAQFEYITKLVLQTSSGFPISGSLQYMDTLGKRTPDIASFEDFLLWSKENKFKWLAWIITLTGFIITVILSILDWRKKRQTKVSLDSF